LELRICNHGRVDRPHAHKAPRLDELAVFVEVAAAGSLAAAARRLGLPKSTVGRAVARVEEDFGVPLVRRMTRGPGLTDAGQRLAGLAASHVGALRDLRSALLVDVHEPHGLLRVTAPAELAALVLGPLVAEFVARHPRVRVELDATLRVVDLVREGFDLAVRVVERRLPPSSLVAKKVARMTFGLFASPGYLAKHGTPRRPEELARHAHLLVRAQGAKHALKLSPRTGDGPAVSVPVQARAASNDVFFLRELALAGAGIGHFTWFAVRAELSAGRLVRVLPDYELGPLQAYLVHARTEQPAPALQAFRRFVAERAPPMLAEP
jgi:DNA-binding transcriptional LysR family regulator